MNRSRGFSLLEVMVAVAILAVGLMWMVEATSRAILAENHAKLVGTATFLARQRMVDLEDELAEKGFTDDAFAKETCDTFEDKGFKRFRWCTVIDKVQLPNTDQVQSLVTKGLEASPLGALASAGQSGSSGSSSSSTSSSNPLSSSSSMLASQFGIIKDVLEQSIRRSRVRIMWWEGNTEQSLEIVQYLTDPKRVDQSIQIPGGGMPGANNAAPGGAPPAGGGPSGSAAPIINIGPSAGPTTGPR